MAPDAFADLLKEFGSRFGPEVLAATVDHWARRVESHLDAKTPVIAEVPYGNDAHHRMDLFPVKAHGAPVVLFVHGDGFAAGEGQVASPFYTNVGRYFAAHGMLCARMNYRAAPTAGWPQPAQDLDGAVAWLLDRADLYGGDPGRLVVIGQSAGAGRIATWLLDDAFRGGARERLKSAVLMSGSYEAVTPLSVGQSPCLGDEPDLDLLHPPRGQVASIHSSPLPVLVTQASNDPDDLRRQSAALAESLGRRGAVVHSVVLQGHNHVSPLMSLGSDDDTVGLMLRRFVFRTTAPARPRPSQGAYDAVTPGGADAP